MTIGEGIHVITADRQLRTRQNNRLLIGGVPLRVLRLSENGAAKATAWFRGIPVGPSHHEQALARRLLDGGLAHPASHGNSITLQSLTIVIPVRNDVGGLQRTLASLGDGLPNLVVVDDGSTTPVPRASLEALGFGHASMIRHAESLGPAAARMAGAALVDTDLVLFVDAGVTIAHGALVELCCLFSDPEVSAVAPRVRSENRPDSLASYEQEFSPLDLGEHPANVGPGRSTTYVPSACLVVRRTTFEDVGGFNAALRFGEDVDLVWRLAERGAVRYHPAVAAQHPARSTWLGWATQRFNYGTSAGRLAVDHVDSMAPWRTSRWSAASIALLSLRHPVLALMCAAAPIRGLARQLHAVPDASVESIRLVAGGHRWAVRSFAENSVRTWLPFSIALLSVRVARAPLFCWMILGWLRRFGRSRPLAFVAIGMADDASYGIGVLVGSMRARTWRALVPKITN